MRDYLEDNYDHDYAFVEGFDDCIIGIDETTMGISYSIPMCIDLIYRLPEIATREKATIYFYEYIFNGEYGTHIPPIFINHFSREIDYWLN